MSYNNRLTKTLALLSVTLLTSTGLFAATVNATESSRAMTTSKAIVIPKGYTVKMGSNPQTAAQVATNLQNDLNNVQNDWANLQNDWANLQNDISSASNLLQSMGSAGNQPQPLVTPPPVTPPTNQATPLDCTGCSLIQDSTNQNNMIVGNCTNPAVMPSNGTTGATAPLINTACNSCILQPIPPIARVQGAAPILSGYSCQCLDNTGAYTIPANLPGGAAVGDQINYQGGQLLDVTQGTLAPILVTLPPSQGTGPGPVIIAGIAQSSIDAPLGQKTQGTTPMPMTTPVDPMPKKPHSKIPVMSPVKKPARR